MPHYLQGFIHPRWCRISAINSNNPFYQLTIGWKGVGSKKYVDRIPMLINRSWEGWYPPNFSEEKCSRNGGLAHFIWCSTSSICLCVWWFCINVFLAKRCSTPKVCDAFLIWFGLRLEKKRYTTRDISSVLDEFDAILMQCCHFHVFIFFFFSARLFPSSVYIP